MISFKLLVVIANNAPTILAKHPIINTRVITIASDQYVHQINT